MWEARRDPVDRAEPLRWWVVGVQFHEAALGRTEGGGWWWWCCCHATLLPSVWMFRRDHETGISFKNKYERRLEVKESIGRLLYMTSASLTG